MCVNKGRCVCTNVFAFCLLSSSLLQAAAEPSQLWRGGSGPALLRLHPGVHLSARLFHIRGFRASRLPFWRQLDRQGAGVQRYVIFRGLRANGEEGGGDEREGGWNIPGKDKAHGNRHQKGVWMDCTHLHVLYNVMRFILHPLCDCTFIYLLLKSSLNLKL